MSKNKVTRVALKIGKVVGFVVLSLIAFLIVVCLLVMLPPVQNFIVGKATNFVSNKTNTRVEVGNIHIWFPTSVVLKNVFIEDQKHDTLLQAGMLRVNIDMLGLLRSRIALSEVYIEDFNSHVYRSPGPDSAFNFTFIPQAFVDTTKAVEKDTAAGPMDISIGRVRLKNFKARYDDDLTGNYGDVRVGHLDVNIDEFTITDNRYHIKSIELDDSKIAFTQTKIAPPEQDSVATIPFVGLDAIDMNNVSVAYSHKAQEFNVSGIFRELEVRSRNINLPKQQLHLERIELNDSEFTVSMPKSDSSANEKQADAMDDPKPWIVKVDELRLDDNKANYDIVNAPQQQKGFDANHIHVSDLTFFVENFSYDGTNIAAEIQQARFKDDKGFELQKFYGDAAYGATGARLRDFELVTNHSRFAHRLEVSYPSIETLSEDVGQAEVDIRLDDSRLGVQDLYYFVPTYQGKLPSNVNVIADVNTVIHGRVNDLNIEKLLLRTGNATHVNISGRVAGLPEADKAYFDMTMHNVTVSRSDALAFMPPGTLPENINIPSSNTLKGYFKGYLNYFDTKIDLNTTSGDLLASVNMDQRNPDTVYHAIATVKNIDLAYILSDTMLGPVSLHADVNGQGLSPTTIAADVKANVTKAVYNNYAYTNFEMNGRIADQTFTGKANMTDSNLAFAFDGLVKFEPDSEQYKFTLDLQGADLYALNLYDEQLRVSMIASADLTGNTADNLNGNASVTKVLLVKEERNYKLDTLAVAAINKPGSSSMNVKGSIVQAEYKGTMAVGDVVNTVKHHITQHFKLGDSIPVPADTAHFALKIRINNSPIITDVLLPGLTDFMPLDIAAEYNNVENTLSCNVTAPRVEYNGTLVDSLNFTLNSTSESLNYALSLDQVTSGPLEFERTTWEGTAKDDLMRWVLAIRDKADTTRLQLTNTLRAHEDGTYRIAFTPDGLVFNNEKWSIPQDNFIQVGGENLWIHNLELTNNKQMLTVESAGDQPSGDLEVRFKDFALATISRIAEQDTALVRGTLNGNTVLKLGEPSFAFTADLRMDSLSFRTIPVGTIVLNGRTEAENVYAAYVKLSEYGNDVEIKGTYAATETPNMNFNAALRQLNMHTIAAFSMGQIRDPYGSMHGNVAITGSSTKPLLNGQLQFDSASFVVSYLNSYFLLQDETMQFDNQAVRFTNFTLRDSAGNTAAVNGNIGMADLSNPRFMLDIATDKFSVINTNATKDELFYGRILVSSDIRVRGDLNLPRVQARIDIEDGSYFTVGIPEKEYTADRGEGVVNFTDPKGLLNPIMTREMVDTVMETQLKGLDVTASIGINRFSTFTLIIDPETGDSLMVRGDASMAFALDPGGGVSLTGTYAINEGVYRLSVQNLVKRDIELQPGSTITWSGSPTDAIMNLQAIYDVRASPIDLMANEIPTEDETQYRQKFEFWVIVNIDGPMMSPTLAFEIQMPPEDRGALGGTVNAKLIQLNEDPSSLNKQVFALMVLNRFVQDNPLETEGDRGVESVARSSVSKFLSQQLNKLTSNYSEIVDVTVDLQSYTDYSTGEAEGRTEANLQLEKKFFNDRLNISFGGALDLEGSRVEENQLSDLAGDVDVEYSLTEDERWRLRGFQQRKYGGLLEGEINERGIGIIFTRDFNKWSQLFTKPDEDDDAVINDVGNSNTGNGDRGGGD